MSFQGHFEGSFHMVLSELYLELKISPLTWMEDCNEQKGAQFFPCNLAYMSSQPGTSTFYHQSDCFLSYYTMHTGFCFYNETSGISAMFKYLTPFNKICITITNFTNHKSICCISQSPVSMLDYDSQNHMHPLYNGLYTLRWKNIHNTSAQETQSSSVEPTEAMTDNLNSSDSRLAGEILLPCGRRLTLQQVYVSEKGTTRSGPIALFIFQRWRHIHFNLKKSVTSLPHEHC